MKKIAFFCIGILSACSQNEGPLQTIGNLPSDLSENSTIEYSGGTFWTVQDHGNKPEIFALDKAGNLIRKIKITNTKNNDWEELTSDASGNLYIGDFGNNGNERRDLAIYKIMASDLQKSEIETSAKTTFHYPEQTEFPPKKTARFFDCEAFFEWNGHFYLFTKNRSGKFDGTTYLYKIPKKPGDFAAQKIGEFKTCDNYRKCAVTAADISPDGKKVALLTSDKVFLFSGFGSDDFFSGKSTVIDLMHVSQKEGLGFYDDNTVYISDEGSKKNPPKLYRLSLEPESDAHE